MLVIRDSNIGPRCDPFELMARLACTWWLDCVCAVFALYPARIAACVAFRSIRYSSTNRACRGVSPTPLRPRSRRSQVMVLCYAEPSASLTLARPRTHSPSRETRVIQGLRVPPQITARQSLFPCPPQAPGGGNSGPIRGIHDLSFLTGSALAYAAWRI